jgi:hypothetical protein
LVFVTFDYGQFGLFGLAGRVVITVGSLTGLALIFRRRFRWRGTKEIAFSLLGAFLTFIVLMPLIIPFFGFFYLGLFGWIATAVMTFLIYSVVVFSILGRRWIQGSFFILGGLLVMSGVFLAIVTYIWIILEDLQEFQILSWFLTMISIGIAILGILFSTGAIVWPKRQTDKLPPPTPTPG